MCLDLPLLKVVIFIYNRENVRKKAKERRMQRRRCKGQDVKERM